MSKTKSAKTIVTENCILTNLAKLSMDQEFTTFDITASVKESYGVTFNNAVIWRLFNTTLIGCIKVVGKIGKSVVYKVTDTVGIVNLIDASIQLPTKEAVEEMPVKVYDSINPVMILGKQNYDRIVLRLRGQSIEDSNIMVLVVAAISHHCCERDSLSFTPSSIYNKLPMIKDYTIMAKITKLFNKRCCISANLSQNENDLWYTLKHEATDYGTLTDNDGVMIELPYGHVVTNVRKVIKPEVVDVVEEVPTVDQATNLHQGLDDDDEEVSLTVEDFIADDDDDIISSDFEVPVSEASIGAGMVALVNEKVTENAELTNKLSITEHRNSELRLQIESLIKQNSELLNRNNELIEESEVFSEMYNQLEKKHNIMTALSKSTTKVETGIVMDGEGQVKLKA